MRQRIVFVVLLNLLLLLSIPFSNAQDERLQIVGSHSILSDVIANVAGDVADVTSVMPRGADPHSFLPSPSDLTALADADIVFINGAFFEEGLLESIENAAEGINIVTASSCVEILAFGGHGDHGHDDHDHADEDHAHEEGEDHDHGDEDHAHEEDEDHDHGDEDHAHEEGEDHADEDHMHEEGEEHSEMGDMSAMAMLCEQHYAEMEALHEDSHEHGDEDHMHEDGEDHADEDHAHEDGEDHAHEDGEDHAHEDGEDHGDEDHIHEDGHDHDHSKAETLGALYQADCGEGHGHDHEEEGEHEDGEEHSDEHAHDHGACDPHVWMEPHNVMYWTMLIRDTLIELDPANAETYTVNASTYLEELDALAHDFVTPMVETIPEENRVLITNHDALGYFAARYDFEVTGTVIQSFSTLAEPSAADVAVVIDLIRDEGVPAIFAETTVSDDLVQQIADETGVQFYVLYTGSLSEADGPASTYVDYMRYNVTTIVEALGSDS